MKVIILIFLVIYVARDHVSAEECSQKCPKIYAPVCGGYKEGGPYATFPNECEYKYANCMNFNEFEITSKGVCQNECVKKCPEIYEPLCAGQEIYTTYTSDCVFNVENCKKLFTDYVLHEDEC